MVLMMPRMPRAIPRLPGPNTLFRGGPLAPQTALQFASNDEVGSDTGIIFKGANLIPRVGSTVLMDVMYVAQIGYYALLFWCSDDNGWHSDTYELGAHPHPNDGTYDGTGQMLVPTGNAGTQQFYEIAGLGSKDYIASPGGPTNFPIVVGAWRTMALRTKLITVSTTNDTIEHVHWPNIASPSDYIRQLLPVVDLATPFGGAGQTTIGASRWRSGVGGADRTDEATSGKVRNIKAFSAGLDIADITSEAVSGLNTPVTIAGSAACHYMNINPTPSDISDKSGAGHNPIWANAYRPTLLTL